MRKHANGRRFCRILVALIAGVAAPMVASGVAHGAEPFADAVAAWHLSDTADAAGENSALEPVGQVRLGADLEPDDADASKARGGDGKAAALSGGHLSGGQGAGGELNLKGDALTLCIRLRDPSGKWDTSLFSKHGGHEKLVYNLFSVDLPAAGPGVDIGFELGTDRGMFQVKLPIDRLDDPAGWHDLIARYDGKRGRLELFADGVLADAVDAAGTLRGDNPEPCVLGGESNGGNVIRSFRGLIDHAALWSRAITDDEIAALSGGKEAVAAGIRRAKELRDRRESEAVARLAADPQRPAYHFLPARNWMNDPNGLVHFKGKYHIFYQYNPHGPAWGNMTWGHAVSEDLVRWKHLPLALHPDQPYDRGGVFSGCIVDNNGVATALYTGVSPEVQCVAVAGDELLTRWTKHAKNPVIPGPPPGLAVTGFRDPCVWREGDTWYMVVGSGIKDVGGTILLYRSKDLAEWEYVHPACVGEKSQSGEMWECPSFFPLGKGADDPWLLAVSPYGPPIYFTGTWKDLRFTPQRRGLIDHGSSLYAPQMFPDAKGRLILFGWLKENRGKAEAAGWQGVQSLPRVITAGADGRPRFDPVEELTSLRGKHAQVRDVEVTPDGSGFLGNLRGDRLELVVEFQAGGADQFGLKLRRSPGGDEETLLVYDRAARALLVRRDKSSQDPAAAKDPCSMPLDLSDDGRLRLRVFLDRSVLEIFTEDGRCLTTRVYPSRPDGLGIDAFAIGGAAKVASLEAWEMESIWAAPQAAR